MKRFLTLIIALTSMVCSVKSDRLTDRNAEILIDSLKNATSAMEVREEFLLDSLERQYQKHGYIREYCVEFSNLDFYNKTSVCDSNLINRDTFYNLMISMSTIQRDAANWTPEDVFCEQSQLNSPSECAVSILQYMYIQLKDNAIKDNLVKLKGNYLKDVYVDGVHQNPYDDAVLFTFLPSDTLFFNDVTFSFPSTIHKYNFKPTIEFDADDGRGYQTINNATRLVVNYSSGIHHLKMRTKYNGNTYYGHCHIRTVQKPDGTRGDNMDSKPINVGEVKGYLTLLKKPISKPTRPLLIVEGFDPNFSNNEGEIKANLKQYGDLGSISMLDDTRYDAILKSFDVYYLDFEDCTKSIKENAKLFEEALDRINSVRDTTGYAPIVLGSSMGGLIARYGLRDMELRGKKHNVGTLICQDTPNLGANIPLGILYAANGLLKIYNRYVQRYYDIDDKINLLREYVYSQSAREMLYNFVDENGNIDNTVHEAFVRELHEMGYPKGDDGTLRCLAISNGNEQIVSESESLLKLTGELSPSGLVDVLVNLMSIAMGPLMGTVMGILTKDLEVGILGILPGQNKLKFTAEINPTGSSRNICDMRITYLKKCCGLNFQRTFFKHIKGDVSSTIKYDIAKGSYYDVNNLELPFDNVTEIKNLFVEGKLQLDYKDHFLFVPTASALDIGEGVASLSQADYTYDYSMQNRPVSPKHSPFHAYYISNKSERHIMMNENISNWLLRQLSTNVVGDDIGSNGSKYYLANLPSSESVSWYSSNISIASINSDGVITCNRHGYVDIIGQLSNGMQYMKRIMSKLPPYTIDAPYSINGYCAKLKLNTDNKEYYRYADKIQCSLATKNQSNPISGWTDCPQMYHYVLLTDNSTDVNVYFKLWYTDNNNIQVSGSPVSIQINTSKPYILEPNYFACSYGSSISLVTFQNITLKKNPAFKYEYTDEMKIRYFESHGGTTPSLGSSITEYTLTPFNVFNYSQIDSFLKNASQHSISNDFLIRNYKGEPIQRFYVSLIKP